MAFWIITEKERMINLENYEIHIEKKKKYSRVYADVTLIKEFETYEDAVKFRDLLFTLLNGKNIEELK